MSNYFILILIYAQIVIHTLGGRDHYEKRSFKRYNDQWKTAKSAWKNLSNSDKVSSHNSTAIKKFTNITVPAPFLAIKPILTHNNVNSDNDDTRTHFLIYPIGGSRMQDLTQPIKTPIPAALSNPGGPNVKLSQSVAIIEGRGQDPRYSDAKNRRIDRLSEIFLRKLSVRQSQDPFHSKSSPSAASHHLPPHRYERPKKSAAIVIVGDKVVELRRNGLTRPRGTVLKNGSVIVGSDSSNRSSQVPASGYGHHTSDRLLFILPPDPSGGGNLSNRPGPDNAHLTSDDKALQHSDDLQQVQLTHQQQQYVPYAYERGYAYSIKQIGPPTSDINKLYPPFLKPPQDPPSMPSAPIFPAYEPQPLPSFPGSPLVGGSDPGSAMDHGKPHPVFGYDTYDSNIGGPRTDERSTQRSHHHSHRSSNTKRSGSKRSSKNGMARRKVKQDTKTLLRKVEKNAPIKQKRFQPSFTYYRRGESNDKGSNASPKTEVKSEASKDIVVTKSAKNLRHVRKGDERVSKNQRSTTTPVPTNSHLEINGYTQYGRVDGQASTNRITALKGMGINLGPEMGKTKALSNLDYLSNVKESHSHETGSRDEDDNGDGGNYDYHRTWKNKSRAPLTRDSSRGSINSNKLSDFNPIPDYQPFPHSSQRSRETEKFSGGGTSKGLGGGIEGMGGDDDNEDFYSPTIFRNPTKSSEHGDSEGYDYHHHVDDRYDGTDVGSVPKVKAFDYGDEGGDTMPRTILKTVENRIKNIQVKCDLFKDIMEIWIDFDEKFGGIIYTKGFFKGSHCKAFGNSATQMYFKFPLDGCGTEIKHQKFQKDFSETKGGKGLDDGGEQYEETELISKPIKKKDAEDDDPRKPLSGDIFYFNTIVILNEAKWAILDGLDKAFRVSCHVGMEGTKKIESFLKVPMIHTQDTEPFEMNLPDVWMKIVQGSDPYQRGSEILELGTIGSIVVTLHDTTCSYDLYLFNCYAHDGYDQDKVQLIDQDGCPTEKNLILPQTVDRGQCNMEDKIKDTMSVSAFKIFKFPDQSQVYFECHAKICFYDCYKPKCSKYSGSEQIDEDTDRSGYDEYKRKKRSHDRHDSATGMGNYGSKVYNGPGNSIVRSVNLTMASPPANRASRFTKRENDVYNKSADINLFQAIKVKIRNVEETEDFENPVIENGAIYYKQNLPPLNKVCFPVIGFITAAGLITSFIFATVFVCIYYLSNRDHKSNNFKLKE